MATAINGNGLVLIAARLLSIWKINHGTGADLSATDAVQYGDWPHPPVKSAAAFVGLWPIDFGARLTGGQPLTTWVNRVTWRAEVWAPASASTPVARFVAGTLIADFLVAAVQTDFASGSSGSLKDYLVDAPTFDRGRFHGAAESTGVAAGHLSFEMDMSYRVPAGV